VTSGELAAFLQITERRFGLRLDDRVSMIEELGTRRAAFHAEPMTEYLARVEAGDPKELRALIAELTVGETYFFRHAEQFHAFANVALPERLAARGRIRVLSAGCSSGEEAYTMAMLVRERVADLNTVQIHAVDVNPVVLDRARRGVYSRWALRAIPPELEERWFTQTGKDYAIAPELRADVTFEQRNLNDDSELFWAPWSWDIVFCRNALMYFTDERSRAAIARIVRSIAPGGYLFLGHAETLRDRSGLELCSSHGTFYYRRAPGTTSAPFAPALVRAPDVPLGGGWFDDIHAATSRVNALVDTALSAMPAPVIESPLVAIRELFAQERFAEALDQLAALPVELSRVPSTLLLRALALTHVGKMAEAEELSLELLGIEPSAGAHYVLALCRPGDAAAMQRACDLDPSFAMARVQLGLIARRAGDRDTARRELAQAIALLEHETAEQIALFGGGFSRQALIALCKSELASVERKR
jgi:chemotaxis protein methyltransferase CheR